MRAGLGGGGVRARMEDQRERERKWWECITGLGRAAGGRSFSHYTPRLRRSHHPLAGRSNRLCGNGPTETQSFCNLLCSKGKAGLQSEPTSKRPSALPSPHKNKSSDPKGKVGPENGPTSKRQSALPPPPQHKSPHSKGKVGPDPLTLAKLPGALPSPPQNKSSHPKGKAGPDLAKTSKLSGALPWPPR